MVSAICFNTFGQTLDNKNNEDCVHASLMIAEPNPHISQSVIGHGFIRLQYPTEKLDYCYSVESGNQESFLDILIGNFKTRVVAIEADEYIGSFNSEGRDVVEYQLNLTDEECRKLWETLDNSLGDQTHEYSNFLHHGCSRECVAYITNTIEGSIRYGENYDSIGNTIVEYFCKSLPQNSFLRLSALIACTGCTDDILSAQDRMIIPSTVPTLLRDAVIIDRNGNERPFFKNEGVTIHKSKNHIDSGFTAPLYIWFLILILWIIVIGIIEVKTRHDIKYISKFTDVSILTIYGLIFISIVLINIFSSIDGFSGWNWNFCIYNPILPIIIWKMDKRDNKGFLILLSYLSFSLLCMAIANEKFIIEQFLLVIAFIIRILTKTIKNHTSITTTTSIQ